MPRVPVPPEVDAFLARPNPAVVATVSPSGEPHTAATWYDWEDGRVFLNMDESRLRLRYMRQNPAVALTVLGEDSWYAQVTLLGRRRRRGLELVRRGQRVDAVRTGGPTVIQRHPPVGPNRFLHRALLDRPP